MFVNNEIGVIQDIPRIGELCRSRGVIFHVDAAQATGKVEIDLEKIKVDLMSFSAHKTYGPKGIGALFVRRKPRVRIEAQIHGGGHERGMRSGTLPVHQIVGMGEAFRIARIEMAEEATRIRKLRDRLLAGLKDIEEVYVNGDMDQRVAHNLNISFNYVEGESMLMALKDIAISSGSACTSASLEPSYVLRALGRNDELAHSSIRFTIGRFTTKKKWTSRLLWLKTRLQNCVNFLPCGKCTKTALILIRFNGLLINHVCCSIRGKLKWHIAIK
jgi:cysteine desulfurase